MSDITNYPLQDAFDTTLSQELFPDDLIMYVNDTGDFVIPVGVTTNAVINPGKSIQENVKVTAKSDNSFTIVRNVSQGASVVTVAQSHGVGSRVIISDNYQFWKDIVDAVNTKIDNNAPDTASARTKWEGTNASPNCQNFVDETARDAAFTAPLQNDECSVGGNRQFYSAALAQWVTYDEGTPTPNASTLVAGRVEIATAAQSIAGTNTGETLAFLSVLPKQIANNIQQGYFIFANSTTGTDAYSATLVPAFTGYTDGMRVTVRVDTANTGACSLELNSQGAVAIKMPFGGDPITGTILSGSFIDVIFDATNVIWRLQNVSTMLVGGNDASLAHYHNLVKNNAIPGNQKHFYRVKDSDIIHDGGGSNQGTVVSVQTSANNNNIARIVLGMVTNATNASKSVHASNPEFRVAGAFLSGTAQEGFIGFVNGAMAGTDLENSVMTLDHFGFIVQDGTLFISCGNGAAQTKTDISATVPSVSNGHVFGASFDGTTATFTVDNASVGTINTTVPDNNLTSFNCAVIADATAAAKTVSLITAGWVAHDE